MVSLRTVLFRPQPLNALARQTVRVPYLVHWKSSHNPPTTIIGRAFSTAPKLLRASAEDKLDIIPRYTFKTLNCTREEYLRYTELSAWHEARGEWEAVKQTSDRELRTEREREYVEHPDLWEGIEMLDGKERQLALEEIYEWRASSRAELDMFLAGKKYDAQMARKKSKSNMTQAEIAKAIDEEERRRRNLMTQAEIAKAIDEEEKAIDEEKKAIDEEERRRRNLM